MELNLLLEFVVLNILNVIIQTTKSIFTIKGGKMQAAIVNAIAYGLYTIVVVYMMCELPLLLKAGIIGLCNLVGVYLVKYFEEKAQKDKLWKVEVTVNSICANEIEGKTKYIPHSKIDLGKHTLFQYYCKSKEDSRQVRNIVNDYGAKYFVAESKVL